MKQTVQPMPTVNVDRALSFSMKLPWPVNRLAFAALRRVLQARGKWSGEMTTIRFGAVEIEAPLSHPAVFWRYRPAGFNMNYLRLAAAVTAARPGIIIDVGANIGDGAALLRGYGVSAPILAIEGADEYAGMLKKNVAKLSSVDVAIYLLSDEATNGLTMEVMDGTAKLVKGNSTTKTISLDELCDAHGVKEIAVLKTDTDGYDAKVIRGSQKILHEMSPVVFAEVDDSLLKGNGDSAAEFIAFLGSVGYELIAAWDNSGRWLGSQPVERGMENWISACPGGPGRPYFDVAAFKDLHRALYEELVRSENRFANNNRPTRELRPVSD